MAGAEDIRTILAQVAAAGVSSGRACSADTAEDALGFVLDCLRGCLLPRGLRFRIDGQEALRIAAGGGRLIRILDCAAAPARRLVGRPLDPGGGDVQAVADLLQTLFRGEQRIGVEHDAGSPDRDTQSGISSETLAEALGLSVLAPDHASRLDQLLSASEEVIIARYGPGDTHVTLREGADLTPDQLAHLRLVLSRDGPLAHVPKDAILFLCQSDPAGDLALFHGVDGPTALILDADSAPDVARFWMDLPGMTMREG